MKGSADVYRQSALIGTISRTSQGAIFEYGDDFYQEHSTDEGGIARHLPYSRKRCETQGVNLHTFFAGLLPEGMRLSALMRKVKTSQDDLLSLLIAIGSDCVGDISVVTSGKAPTASTPAADLDRLDEVVFADLFRQSIGYAGKGAEPTIPGVQEKISASMISFPLRSRKGANAYILKLNPEDKPLLVENEEYFLRMAKVCGLEVNAAKIIRDKTGAAGLLIERFDRVAGENVVRVHQEDACQFLDRYPADKYHITCSEIAEGLALCSAPVIEVARFVRLVAFSYLIGNGDLHAKNVSIRVLPKSGRIEMTPAYDLLSTLPYGDQKMALGLDGRDDNLKRAQLVAFGKRYGIREAACHGILDEMVEGSVVWIKNVGEIGFSEKKTQQLGRLMAKRRKDLS